jgi:PST family polysaccharide transporter
VFSCVAVEGLKDGPHSEMILTARQLYQQLQTRIGSSTGKNVLSLYALHFGNYVLPLATVPYLVRVLGPDRFGAVAFGQSVMAYSSLIVSYGFDWSATRKIATAKENLQLVQRIAAGVWGAKALLCLLTFFVVLGGAKFIPKMSAVFDLLMILYGTVVGGTLFPTWLFQGLARMASISAINLGVRFMGAAMIFLLVRRPDHFLRYGEILSFQAIAAGVLGIWIGSRNLGVCPTLPSLHEIWHAFEEGATIFLTTAAISFYTTGNSFILGLLTNTTTVGYYSAAEKITNAAVGLTGPLSQAVYPNFSKLAADSRERALVWGRRMLGFLTSVTVPMSLILFFGASFVVRIFLGSSYRPSVAVLSILAPLPFLISCSNVFGVQLLFPFGYEKRVLAVVTLAGLLNLGLAVLLAPRWGASGMALSVMLSEAVVTFGTFACCCHARVNPLRCGAQGLG